MGRLTIDLTDQQHRSLKALAALQGKSIKQYATERLIPTQSADDSAWRDLKALLERRIAEGLAGGVSEQGIDAIIEDEFGRDGGA